MSHSQFHSIDCLYLDMHGLIFETSVWLLAGSTRLLVPTDWTSSGFTPGGANTPQDQVASIPAYHSTSCIRLEVWINLVPISWNLIFKQSSAKFRKAHSSAHKLRPDLILVVYLNRSLVAKVTVLNSSTLSSPQAWIEIRWGLRFNSAQLRCKVGIILR